MRRFIAARLLHAAIVVLLVTAIAFVLLRMAPGEPFAYDESGVSPAVRAEWRRAFGYDRPVPEQFVRYLGSVAQGDFGYSITYRRPVSALLADALPRTLTLSAIALVLASIIGIGLGVAAGSAHRSRRDRIISTTSVVIYSVPEFWLALIVQLTLGSALGLFPITGMSNPIIADYGSTLEVVRDRLRHMAMPILSLTLLISVVLARFQRAALIDVLPSDYLRTARAKGVPERSVMLRHALRNALTPTITLLSVIVPMVLGGVFFIEFVFGWQGLGWLTVTSVLANDYDVATASVIISGVLVASASLAADLLTAFADPRIRDG